MISRSIEDKNVSSLMCVDRREWDMEIIRDIFNERDQQAITRINLDENVN